MERRRVWCVVLMVLAVTGAGACSSAEPIDSVIEGRSDVSTIDGSNGEAEDADAEIDDPGAAADLEAEDDVVESAATVSEPRFDPLPDPADLDQVEDVFRSLLGPTDDFVTQARRVAPDFSEIPNPPGAVITEVRISYSGGPGDPNFEAVYSTSVILRSTSEPEDLASSMEQAILADNPSWQIDSRATSLRANGPVLKFDLPDVQQPGGEQNLTPDLRIIIEPAEAGGSEVRVSTNGGGPSFPSPDPYSGWQDAFPIPDGTVFWAGGITIDGDEGTLQLSASHVVSTAGLAEYRDEYLALLAERGLTVESEAPYREGVEFLATGDPRFATLDIKACCTENEYITEATNLRIIGTISL